LYIPFDVEVYKLPEPVVSYFYRVVRPGCIEIEVFGFFGIRQKPPSKLVQSFGGLVGG
jgi:hypothetical protein